MLNTVENIVNALKDISVEELSADEVGLITADVKCKLEQGWTGHEIYSYIKNTEHINPILDETTALNRMRRIHESVEERLRLESA